MRAHAAPANSGPKWSPTPALAPARRPRTWSGVQATSGGSRTSHTHAHSLACTEDDIHPCMPRVTPPAHHSLAGQPGEEGEQRLAHGRDLLAVGSRHAVPTPSHHVQLNRRFSESAVGCGRDPRELERLRGSVCVECQKYMQIQLPKLVSLGLRSCNCWGPLTLSLCLKTSQSVKSGSKNLRHS